MESFSGAIVNPSVEIRPSPIGGFGAFAGAPLAEGEVLFSIPRSACVTVSDAVEDTECGEPINNLLKKAGPGGTTVALAGYLAKEYLKLRAIELGTRRTAEAEAGTETDVSGLSELFDDVPFAPYILTLPWERGINDQEHVLFWSEADVEEYLAGSLAYEEAKSLRREVRLAVQVLNGLVGPSVRTARGQRTVNPIFSLLPSWLNGSGDGSSDGDGDGDKNQPKTQSAADDVEGLEEAVVGAFVTILTRSFVTDVYEERLVPLLDMLQHSDTSSVTHSGDERGGVVVRAAFDIAEGDEIFNRYQKETEDEGVDGQGRVDGGERDMPRHRFFTRFGFVPGNTVPVRQLLAERCELLYPQRREV